MKKIFLFIPCLTLVFFVAAQQAVINPFPKTITVAGSAEMEIVPDEIYVNIELREYQKKNDAKKDLDQLKSNFLAACRSIGLADSLVSIVSYSGYNDYFSWKQSKKKQPDLFASITYQVKFKSNVLMDQLVEKLDDEATKSFVIVSTNHTRITEFRKQLKIEAIKAAKNKGVYLTEAINEKLGEAIKIDEPDEPQGIPVQRFRSQAVSNAVYENSSIDIDNSSGLIGFKKIKLRFEVNVIFALR